MAPARKKGRGKPGDEVPVELLEELEEWIDNPEPQLLHKLILLLEWVAYIENRGEGAEATLALLEELKGAHSSIERRPGR